MIQKDTYTGWGIEVKKSPKKLGHFITEVIAIQAKNRQEASQIVCMARALVIATLPHSRPDDSYFKRQNGYFTLSMTANPKFGLPYGSIPRMLLAETVALYKGDNLWIT